MSDAEGKVSHVRILGGEMMHIITDHSSQQVIVQNVGDGGRAAAFPVPEAATSVVNHATWSRYGHGFTSFRTQGGQRAWVCVGGYSNYASRFGKSDQQNLASAPMLNDCIISYDSGVTWVQQASDIAPAGLADGVLLHRSTSTGGDVLTYLGGVTIADGSTSRQGTRRVYQSSDLGLTWTRLTEDSGLMHCDFAAMYTSDGRIVAVGGNDVTFDAGIDIIISSFSRAVRVSTDFGQSFASFQLQEENLSLPTFEPVVDPDSPLPSINYFTQHSGFGFCALRNDRLLMHGGVWGSGDGVLRQTTVVFDARASSADAAFLWVQPQNQRGSTYDNVRHRFPSARTRCRLAYDEDTGTIALVGGERHERWFETFYLAHESDAVQLANGGTFWREQYALTDENGLCTTFARVARPGLAFHDSRLHVVFGAVSKNFRRQLERTQNGPGYELEYISSPHVFSFPVKMLRRHAATGRPTATTRFENGGMRLVATLRPFFGGFVPGQRYFGRNSHVEYIAGDAPLILTVPHGGLDEPVEVSQRESVAGVEFATSHDGWTVQAAEAFVREYQVLHGGRRPHVVIMHMRRNRVDANRHLWVATGGRSAATETAEGARAWWEYNEFIGCAAERVEHDWGRGLVVDLHGHSHDGSAYTDPADSGVQIDGAWIEIGLLNVLRATQKDLDLLRRVHESEVTLKVSAGDSGVDISLRRLFLESQTRHADMTLAEFVTGHRSLGGLLQARAVPACPSPRFPYPSNPPFFLGGAITQTYGSSAFPEAWLASYDEGGQWSWLSQSVLDCVMIEINSGIRQTSSQRDSFVRSLAEAVSLFWNQNASVTV